MNAVLDAGDFGDFFAELYGKEAFPWQRRLAEHVCREGVWPAALALPTGAGKTAAIDIAVFHLAFDLSRGGPRRAPLRIIFTVDRRLIVDEAYDRARTLAARLDASATPVVRRVADALRRIAGDGAHALHVGRLRGGVPREGDWSRTPAQPTVLSSTVDQVGSRLLFRGYGVRPTMAPVHAGLLGVDALILLDEVHLSEPFRQTLDAIGRGRERRANLAPWGYVQLSATPRGERSTFALDENDRANAILSSRILAPKPAMLCLLKKTEFGSVEHAQRIADEALRLSAYGDNPDGKRVLVVVNRVQLARRVYARLAAKLDNQDRRGHDRDNVLALMIGRGRDIEKDAIRDAVVSRVRSGVGQRDESPAAPFILVATQTVEAGADLDFDVLVSEIAPLDALRQRFGRLNRMGRPIRAQAVIVATDTEVAPSAKPDPIYGIASQETWKFLRVRSDQEPTGTVDFGIDAWQSPDEATLQAMRAPAQDAPILLPQLIAAFARTSPAPAAGPEAALFLHGEPSGVADVNVIWRADLPLGSPAANDDQRETAEGVVRRTLTLLPPRPGEVAALPISAVRRWLRGERAADAADVECGANIDPLSVRSETIVAFRWTGPENPVDVISEPKRRLRPGDTIVVSSAVGGCDKFGWNPDGHGTVQDLADTAALAYAHRGYAFRIHRALLQQAYIAEHSDAQGSNVDDQVETLWKAVQRELNADGSREHERIANIREIVGLPHSWKEALGRFDLKPQLLSYGVADAEGDYANGAIVFAPRGVRITDRDAARRIEPVATSSTESDDLGAQAKEAEGLVEHSAAVERLARKFADDLGLPEALASDIELAAALHDLGKADRRFQVYLAGGEWQIPIDWSTTPKHLLAKSGIRRSPWEEAEARDRSGLPEQWRHESLSVAIAVGHERLTRANDSELVLWLVGTHHGYGRPDFPHWDGEDDRESREFSGFDGAPIMVKSGSAPGRIDCAFSMAGSDGSRRIDWRQLFARVLDRYGAWELAHMEAVLRLADHRASEAGARVILDRLASKVELGAS